MDAIVVQSLIGGATLGGSLIGSFVGSKIAIAVLREKIAKIELEIELLRIAKHDHAGLLTQHHFRLRNLDKLED